MSYYLSSMTNDDFNKARKVPKFMIIRNDRHREIARQKYESILRIKNKDKRKVEKVKL